MRLTLKTDAAGDAMTAAIAASTFFCNPRLQKQAVLLHTGQLTEEAAPSSPNVTFEKPDIGRWFFLALPMCSTVVNRERAAQEVVGRRRLKPRKHNKARAICIELGVIWGSVLASHFQ